MEETTSPRFPHSGHAERSLKFSFSVEIPMTFRITAARSLFDPDNEVLPAALGDARRLVVVHDRAVRTMMPTLHECMRAWRDAGRLDGYCAVDTAEHEGLDELDAWRVVLDAGVREHLGRHDCFVALGRERTNRVVSLVSTSFRRYTPAVHISCDLPSLVATLRTGNRVTVAGEPIAATERDAHIIVDEDSFCSSEALTGDERAALLSLSLLDTEALDRLSALADAGYTAGEAAEAARGESLRVALDLCQRLGPGHEAWRIGELPLTLPTALEPPHERVRSLIGAAEEATHVGLFPNDAFKQVRKLADWLYPDLGIALSSAARHVTDRAQQAHRVLGGAPAGEPGVARHSADDGLAAATARQDVIVAAFAQWQPLNQAAHRHRRSAHGSRPLAGFRTDAAIQRAFKVEFRPGLLDPDNGGFEDLLPVGARVLVVVDAYSEDVLRRVELCLDRYREDGRISRYAIAPMRVSSRRKTFDHVLSVIRKANELGLREDDRIIAVGGGTIMDIVGYAAFLYDGNTPYARFPTTLVGMIDAGIGIKVGVNMVGKKNFVGAYHPPVACVCDTSFLVTLPVPELRCGAAEAVKIGAVCDANLFDLLERHHAVLLSGKDSPEVKAIVDRSVSAMLYELEPNPFEQNLRRLPDFGHEFGHMLESLSGYQLRHGEAVAIGMALSSQLASYTGRLSAAELERILSALGAIGLPSWGPACEADVLWSKLRDDVVPHKAGHLYLAVPTAIGAGDYIDSLDEISPSMLQHACATLEARTRKAA